MAVTKDQVAQLISSRGFEAEASETWNSQITTAGRIVTTYITPKYPANIASEIELWLAAHLVSMSNHRQMKTKGGGGSASTTYTGEFDKGLDATTFGQTVKFLDSLKILAGMDDDKGLNRGHIYAV